MKDLSNLRCLMLCQNINFLRAVSLDENAGKTKEKANDRRKFTACRVSHPCKTQVKVINLANQILN